MFNLVNLFNLIVVCVVFYSSYNFIRIFTVFFNKEKVLTDRGHKHLAFYTVLLIISLLQLLGIFDFMNYIGIRIK